MKTLKDVKPGQTVTIVKLHTLNSKQYALTENFEEEQKEN